jgi:phage terminase large subunit-like protein
LTPAERRRREDLLAALQEQHRRASQRLFYRMFPDEDTKQPDGSTFHSRAKYPKHMDFISAGAQYRERGFIAANRIGKTRLGSYETTAHLTGQYPHWWNGKRFSGPIRAWAAGKTNETTRDVVQKELLGEVVFLGGRKGFSGTGMIPGDRIGAVTWKQGVADLADTVKVKHVSGGWSTLGLKSYQQGRGSFEGTAQHLIWTDEEPPLDVYGEMLIRTATTGGIVMLTFTPLDGISETVRQFMPRP